MKDFAYFIRISLNVVIKDFANFHDEVLIFLRILFNFVIKEFSYYIRILLNFISVEYLYSIIFLIFEFMNFESFCSSGTCFS